MRKCPSAAAAGFLMENTNADSAGLEGENAEGSGPGCLWKTSARLRVREGCQPLFTQVE